MSVYNYEAIDEAGRKHKGVLSAENQQQLRQQLRMRGWIPITIKDSAKEFSFKSLSFKRTTKVFSTKTLTAFTRELAILIEGGLPLEKALKLIAMQTEKPELRGIISSIHTDIVEGNSFAGSLKAFPDDFPTIYHSTIAAGERMGDLTGVLNKLADYGETHLRTLNKVKMAMLYPVILSLFSILALAGLLTFVFPDIAKIFIQSGKPLPWITTVLISLSDGMRHYGIVIGVLLLVLYGVSYRTFSRPKSLQYLHSKLLRLPVLGKLFLAIDMMRFTNTLSMLRNSSVPLSEAVDIASNVMANRWLHSITQQVRADIISGSSLSQAFAHAACFPPSFTSLISGGEESGELDRVLTLAARNQMRELESRVLFGVAILEPCIILFMGLMVLIVVLAIMLPILTMNQLVQ